jgi:hypothetical protein
MEWLPGEIDCRFRALIALDLEDGRGGEIRTRDLYVPNVALYQAKLRPETVF